MEKLETFQKNFDTVLDRRFREQAELIDRLFLLRFEEWDKRWDAKFDQKMDEKLGQLEQRLEQNLERKLEQKLEEKLEAKLQPLRGELAIVSEGIKILLKRRR